MLAASAAAACLLAPAPALCQQSLDQAFADGFSLLRFEPSPAGDRFFVVPEGAVPAGEPGIRAHALGHYTLRPSLVRTDNVTGQDRELVSKQLFVHAGLSYVPTSWQVRAGLRRKRLRVTQGVYRALRKVDCAQNPRERDWTGGH